MSKVPGLPDSEDDRFDEEPAEHVPGSFLSSLPQFFVFPMILVATITAIYLLLRTISGGGVMSADEMVAAVRSAPGDQSRWQAAYNLSDALRQGKITLDEVEASRVDALYDDLAGQSPELKSFLLSVLAYKDDASSTERALAALEDDDPIVRSHAIHALHLLGDEAAVPALADVFRGSRPWEERFMAMGALAAIGTPEARDVLAGRLGQGDGLEHRNLVMALAQAGDLRASEWLGALLERADYDGDTSILGQNYASLPDASREAVRADLIEQFLVNACRAAEALGDSEMIEPLQRLREGDPSTKVKSAAIHALHALGGEDPAQ